MHSDQKRILLAVGKNLRRARHETCLSLPHMAKLSKVSQGNCSKVENGGNVTLATLYRLCWVIGVHPRDVLPEFRS